MGMVINILIRLSILYFLAEVLLNPTDLRFEGKAIPIRNFIIVITLSLLFPILYFLKKKFKKYPFWLDNLYLSIFLLDMAGNSFNLYDRFFYFDLIPHIHGTGAIAIIFVRVLGFPALSAIGVANIIHMLLEAQEYYTDVLFKTHNVRGLFDTINDLMVGLLGTIVYVIIYKLWKNKWVLTNIFKV